MTITLPVAVLVLGVFLIGVLRNNLRNLLDAVTQRILKGANPSVKFPGGKVVLDDLPSLEEPKKIATDLADNDFDSQDRDGL